MICLHDWKHKNSKKKHEHTVITVFSFVVCFFIPLPNEYEIHVPAICWYLYVFCLFQVEQRDVPGIDSAYLAMDTEEGVEVVWNEVQFSERKNFKAQEDKIQYVFENLTQLEHPNIVKFHRYWTDTHNDKPRVSVYYSLYWNPII